MNRKVIVLGFIGLLILLTNATAEEKKNLMDDMKDTLTDLSGMYNGVNQNEFQKKQIAKTVQHYNDILRKSGAKFLAEDVENVVKEFPETDEIFKELGYVISNMKKEKSRFERNWEWLIFGAVFVVIGISGFCIYYFQPVDNVPNKYEYEYENDNAFGANIA